MKRKRIISEISITIIFLIIATFGYFTVSYSADIGDGTFPVRAENTNIVPFVDKSSFLDKASTPADSFCLIGTLDTCNGGEVVSYDTDNNGFVEVIYEKKLSGVYPAIFYENRNGNFTLVHTLGVYGPVWDVGDFDGDNKADLLTQYVNEVRIYESPDANSYPSTLVWSAPLSAPIWCHARGGLDLDRDGMKEIIVVNNGFDHTVRIYENDGDNVYQLVYETPVLPGPQTSVLTGDFDNDGLMEFLAAHRGGAPMIIYENISDNNYQQTAVVAYDKDNGNAGLGDDLDGDGLLELILGGEVLSDCRDYVTFFESDADNSFIETYEIEFPFDDVCGNLVRPFVGNVVGDANSELVLARYKDWRVYKATGDNQYEEIYSQEEPARIARQLFLAETNGNGHREIIIASAYIGPTKVYEARVSCIICGDVDGSGAVNVGDMTYLVNYLFRGGPSPDPIEVADVNASGGVNVADLTYLVNYLFRGGPPPVCNQR